MLVLVHSPQSRSSRMIWLLEELEADYQIRYVQVSRMDGSGGPDPANPHPDKKVPALEHDGALVTESAAIALYLTDLHPHSGIGPIVGDPWRGAYLTWLAYYAGVIEPVVSIEYAGLGENETLRRTFRGLHEMQTRIAAALDKHDYLLGDDFSAADLMLASLGQFARAMLPPGDRIDAYLARLNARPALARALKKDSPPS